MPEHLEMNQRCARGRARDRFKMPILLAALLAAQALPGCDESQAPTPAPAPAPEAPKPNAPATNPGGGHVHVAPHGGTLVILEHETAHLECVLDPAVGSLTVYVLDGHAEKAVRLRQPLVSLVIDAVATGEGEPVKLPKPMELALLAVANPLTGETAEESSQFAGGAEQLKGVKRFTGRWPGLVVRGREYKNVAFKYPEGNEGGQADRAEQAKPTAPAGSAEPARTGAPAASGPANDRTSPSDAKPSSGPAPAAPAPAEPAPAEPATPKAPVLQE